MIFYYTYDCSSTNVRMFVRRGTSEYLWFVRTDIDDCAALGIEIFKLRCIIILHNAAVCVRSRSDRIVSIQQHISSPQENIYCCYFLFLYFDHIVRSAARPPKLAPIYFIITYIYCRIWLYSARIPIFFPLINLWCFWYLISGCS